MCLRLYLESVFVSVLVFGTCVCMCTCIWNVFVSTLCSQGLRQYNAVLQDSTTGGPIDSPSALFPAPRLPLFFIFSCVKHSSFTLDKSKPLPVIVLSTN